MDQKKMLAELEELKQNPEKIRAMIALLEGLLDEEGSSLTKIRAQEFEEKVREKVIFHLKELGVPQHLVGYVYLEYGLTSILMRKRVMLPPMVGSFYPELAQKFEANVSRVERGIRRAIESCWDRAGVEKLEEYFGNTVSLEKGRPTNAEFIAVLANKIRREIYNQ